MIIKKQHNVLEKGKTVRNYLKKIRLAKNMSQQYVAELIGISQQYYAFIETGQRQLDMSLTIAKALSEALDVPLKEILRHEERFRAGGQKNI